jgi:hypothetical protein
MSNEDIGRFEANELTIRCRSTGATRVEVWCKCYTKEQIDDLVAWLKLAQTVTLEWEAIVETGK